MRSSYNHRRGTHTKAQLSQLQTYLTTLLHITELRLGQQPDCTITQNLLERIQYERAKTRDAYNDACNNPKEGE